MSKTLAPGEAADQSWHSPTSSLFGVQRPSPPPPVCKGLNAHVQALQSLAEANVSLKSKEGCILGDWKSATPGQGGHVRCLIQKEGPPGRHWGSGDPAGDCLGGLLLSSHPPSLFVPRPVAPSLFPHSPLCSLIPHHCPPSRGRGTL